MIRQRRMILDEFPVLRSHFTAEEVYLRFRGRMRIPNISLGWAYRNFELLTQIYEIKNS